MISQEHCRKQGASKGDPISEKQGDAGVEELMRNQDLAWMQRCDMITDGGGGLIL